MRHLKVWLATVLLLGLAGCGGGGGSAGSTGGGGSSSITLSITDSSGAVLSTNAINASSAFFVRATVRASANGSVANQLVSFSTDAALATLSAPSALTDASGVARVQISPVAAGAGTVTATTAGGGMGSLAFQTSAANVSLRDLVAAQTTLNTRQSTDVSVQVLVNNIPALASEANITFTASCGTFSPATAATGAGGIARSTYTPAANCSGQINLTATAPGASPLSRSVTVVATAPASIRFVSVSAPLLVVSTASSGVTTSAVTFQVSDDGGAGLRSQNVVLTLDSRSLELGVRFSVNGVASRDPQTLTSDAAGRVQVVVRSGTVPTPVVVTAALASDPTVRASSSGLAVTTGRAAQDRISLAVSMLAIEAAVGASGSTDGVQTTLTMRIADRLGNPVPNDTAVNFVSSAGRVDGACFTTDSSCSVVFTTQGPRPGSGLVTVLGFLDGEESFLDGNGNNSWDVGEQFSNRGRIYLDLNGNGVYDQSDQLIGDTAPGTTSCAGTGTTVANTCDDTWSGNTRVSTSARIAWSSSDAVFSGIDRSSIQEVMPATTPRQFSGLVRAILADNRGNSMPAGTSIAVSGCGGATVSPTSVPNSIAPTAIVVTFAPMTVACTLRITTASPSGVQSTSAPITLP